MTRRRWVVAVTAMATAALISACAPAPGGAVDSTVTVTTTPTTTPSTAQPTAPPRNPANVPGDAAAASPRSPSPTPVTGTSASAPSGAQARNTPGVADGPPSPTGPAVTGPATAPTAPALTTSPATSSPAEPDGTFTLALAGDVNFSERTADLLAADPATALQQAADQLSKADVTMVNLETAITTRGSPAPKQFHFRAPATALQALAAGGVDVATMANNHAVDYGDQGLADTLSAIATSPIPVIGIGETAEQAYAPYVTTVNGTRLAILAASQVQDWTLATHIATANSPGIASAYSDRLSDAVSAAAAQADVVVVYLHWGIEYDTCPSQEQRSLAAKLAKAGAAAVVGTHAHVLQGAGWRDDGVYVAYGLSNYYWWRSFGNEQDDNGVLTLTFAGGRVTDADFLPTHLDDRGVPQVATGAQRERILAQWERDRACSDLSAAAPH